jgi:hypothetical protein
MRLSPTYYILRTLRHQVHLHHQVLVGVANPALGRSKRLQHLGISPCSVCSGGVSKLTISATIAKPTVEISHVLHKTVGSSSRIRKTSHDISQRSTPTAEDGYARLRAVYVRMVSPSRDWTISEDTWRISILNYDSCKMQTRVSLIKLHLSIVRHVAPMPLQFRSVFDSVIALVLWCIPSCPFAKMLGEARI